jgi:hypothetical protein
MATFRRKAPLRRFRTPVGHLRLRKCLSLLMLEQYSSFEAQATMGHDKADAPQTLLERAVAGGADGIDIEYDKGGGLEVTFMRGNSGIGEVIHDEPRERAIVSSIVKKAKLDRRTRGAFRTEIAGQTYAIQAETYENFNEWAYRLRIKAARG